MKKISELDNMAIKKRNDLGEDAESPIDIFSVANTINNLTLVLYPFGENISGMCIKGNNNLIAINSNMSIGRQRFSLAHELYHLYFDEETRRSISCCGRFDYGDDKEKEADIFASHFLLPTYALYKSVSDIEKIDKEEIIKIEQLFGLSRQAILYRLKEEKRIDEKLYNKMLKDVKLSASILGYDTKLYKPTPENERMNTVGRYIRIVNELYDRDLISTGKYEEYLLDAFRDDIVYGTEEEQQETVD